MNEMFKWNGLWEIKIRNIHTGEIKKEYVKNKIVDAALDNLIKPLWDNSALDMMIRYFAVGTSNTAVQNTDTKLIAEYFRTPPTIASAKTNTGEVTTEFVLLATEANTQLEEIGIFCGATATGTADTGILLSRLLWSHFKTSSEEITFSRVDSLIRA